MTMEDGTVSIDRGTLSEVYEWAEAIVFSLVCVVLLFTFVFRIVGVDGHSMENTLQDKDRVIITRLNYTPKQGDIVVFPVKDPNVASMPLIKRIIAVGGQTVDIDFAKGVVKVDGKTLNEPYIKEPTYREGDVKFPIKVPAGKVFVMGDNRNNSLDGRFQEIGFIDVRDILGRAIFRIYPLGKIGPL